MQLTGAKVQMVERCSAIDGTWGLRAENVELARRVAKPLMEKVAIGRASSSPATASSRTSRSTRAAASGRSTRCRCSPARTAWRSD